MAPTILRKLARACRSFEPTFRYLYNFTPTMAYKFDRHSLSGEAARVLADLNRDGVASTSAQALLGPDSCYHELDNTVGRLEYGLADQLAAARAAANDQTSVNQKKNYLFPLLGERPVVDTDSIYVRFALQKPILQIANAYFDMYIRLKSYNVLHTFITRGEASTSQFWHRDRDDLHYILKVFVYLSDVDDGAGPFIYGGGTHSKRKLRQEPAYFLEDGYVMRTNDSQMAEVVSPEQWIKCLGPKGTIIFADTRGYHKGGLARDRDRIMYTCMFGSPLSPEYFERPNKISLPLDRQQAFALTTPKLRA